MNAIRQFLVLAVILGAPMAALSAQAPSRLSENEVKGMLKRIDKDTERFRKSVESSLDGSPLNGTKSEEQINEYIKALNGATSALKTSFSDDQTASSVVEEILRRASRIEGFMKQNPMNERSQTDWSVLRADLLHLAQAYGVRWGSGGVSGRPYRVSEDEIESLLSRIDSRSERFRSSLNSALDKSEFNNTKTEDLFNAFVKDFTAATDQLKSRYRDKDAAPDSAEEVLRRAKFIDEHMRKHPLTSKAQSDWGHVRTDLEQLARYYNVKWQW
jgi:hypothetical protein